jgi:hypothetical protein
VEDEVAEWDGIGAESRCGVEHEVAEWRGIVVWGDRVAQWSGSGGIEAWGDELEDEVGTATCGVGG